MSEKIKLLAQGVHVAPFLWALQSQPELWNQHTTRTEDPASPHHGLDDIWVRYGDAERAKDGAAHESHWYPCADALGIKPLVYDLMRQVEGDQLGGVLITRIAHGPRLARPLLPEVRGADHQRPRPAVLLRRRGA